MNIPAILWSQNKKNINIKICLSDSKNVNLSVDENIDFSCESNNLNYGFSFKLLNEIKSKPVVNIYGNNISIVLNKDKNVWWSKLTDDINFKKNIKIDWDKWVDEDEVMENDNSNFDIGNMQEMMKMMQMQNINDSPDESCSPGKYINNNEENIYCKSDSNQKCSSGCCVP